VSAELITVIAVLTYASRAVALVVMPHPPPRVRSVLDRVPAPLFASLAAISLVEDGELASPETLSAAVGALVATPTRSLLWVLVGGVVGYAFGSLVFR
jgi:branched-subunit amino acid transport protein